MSSCIMQNSKNAQACIHSQADLNIGHCVEMCCVEHTIIIKVFLRVMNFVLGRLSCTILGNVYTIIL